MQTLNYLTPVFVASLSLPTLYPVSMNTSTKLDFVNVSVGDITTSSGFVNDHDLATDGDLSPWLVYTVVSVYLLVMMMCFFGNVPLLLAVYHFSYLHRNTYYFLSSTALADIILCMILPVDIIGLLTEGWLIENMFCAIQAYSAYLVFYPAALSIMFTAFCRYVQVVHSSRLQFFKKKVILVSFLSYTWLIGPIIMIPAMLDTNKDTVFVKSYRICRIDKNDHKYYITIGRCLVEGPCPILMFYFYAHIYLKYWKTRKRIHNAQTSNGTTDIEMDTASSNRNSQGNQKMSAMQIREMKLTRTTLTICLAFFCCWIVPGIITFASNNILNYKSDLMLVSLMIRRTGPLFNVLINYISNSRLKQAMFSFMPRSCRKSRRIYPIV